MENLRLIQLYGQGTDDIDSSPFEVIDTFHIRSELHKASLSKEEKKMLAMYDMKLLSNIRSIYEHVGQVYDFSKSQEPVDEWWWRLDLLLKGEIILNASPLRDEVI